MTELNLHWMKIQKQPGQFLKLKQVVIFCTVYCIQVSVPGSHRSKLKKDCSDV